MALCRPDHGEVFNIHPTGEQYTEFFSRAIVRTPELEVIRLVLPRGESLREHGFAGDCTLQCVEGRVQLDVGGQQVLLRESEMTCLAAHQLHALHALTHAVVLVTIVLHKSGVVVH